MIPALLIILLCQLLGETLSRSLGLPIPGPVLGMVFMLLGLILSQRLRAVIRPVAQVILGALSLLLVPAGVGAIGQFFTLGDQTLPVVLAVVGSTILAIASGAVTFVVIARLIGAREAKE